MRFNDLKQNQRTINMADGVSFKVRSIFGQDTIDVTVPTPEVVEKEVKEKILIVLEYRVKIINKTTGEPISIDQLSRLAFYTKDATALTDTDCVVFDYASPVDTDPELYFGSDDNPGLGWDDEEECFFVSLDAFEDPDMPIAEDRFNMAAAGEIKYFMVYSCIGGIPDMDEVTEFEVVTENQQFEAVSEDVDRWKEEALIPPNLVSGDFNAADYYEDTMSCNYELFVLVRLGDYVVVFETIHQGYAENIVKDNGHIAVWPELFADISDWYSEVTNAGGLSPVISTTSTCNTILDWPECDPSGNDSEVNSCTGENDTVECTYSETGTDPKTTLQTHQVHVTAAAGGTSHIYFTYHQARYSHSFSFNYIDVLTVSEYDASYDRETVDGASGYNDVEYARNTRLITPWGTIFDMAGQVGSADPATVVEIKNNNNAACVPVGYTRSCNSVFCFIGGCVEKIHRWNWTGGGWGSNEFDSIHYNAIGILEYYNDADRITVDMNDMTAVPDVGEGIANLAQAHCEDYYDTYGGYPSAIYAQMSIEHKRWS